MSIALNDFSIAKPQTSTRAEASKQPEFESRKTNKAAPVQPLFSVEELEQFQKDDAAAGAAIARIMSTLFTYTVIIMCVVIYWTFLVVE